MTAVVPNKDKAIDSDAIFKLTLKGGQPELAGGPKSDPSLGKRVGGAEEANIPKQPCPIQISIEVRKKDGTITSVVRGAENLGEVVEVFKLR